MSDASQPLDAAVRRGPCGTVLDDQDERRRAPATPFNAPVLVSDFRHRQAAGRITCSAPNNKICSVVGDRPATKIAAHSGGDARQPEVLA